MEVYETPGKMSFETEAIQTDIFYNKVTTVAAGCCCCGRVGFEL